MSFPMKIHLHFVTVLLIGGSLRGGETKIAPDQFQLEAGQGAEAHAVVSNDGPGNQPALMVEVSKLGSEFWSVEVRAPGITMEPGKTYELKFQAKSTPARYVYVVPEKTDGNQASLALGTTLQIPEEWTRCIVFFHAAEGSSSGRLTLSSLSAVPASYWFSDFSLMEE
jgi:Carbohydrate binding domain